MSHIKTLVAMCFLVLVLGLGVSEGIAHEWMAPVDAANIENPIVMDETSIEMGKTIYAENCAACHGNTLEGLPAVETGLEMGSPNLKQRIKTHSDGDFFWKIQQGRGDMPSFSEDLSDKEIWYVIHYIRNEAE